MPKLTVDGLIRDDSKWARSPNAYNKNTIGGKNVNLVRTIAIVAICTFCVVSTPAFAQKTGSRLGSTATKSDAPKVFDAVMDCYVSKYPKTVVRLLAMVPGSPEEMKLQASIKGALGVCKDSNTKLVSNANELQTSNDRVRRTLAVKMLQRNPAVIPAGLPSDAPKSSPVEIKLIGVSSHDADAMNILRFGHCVVTKDWALARNLVLAKTGSKQEKAARSAIATVMPACITVGATLDIDPVLIQPLIGDAVYQIIATTNADMAQMPASEK
jgi:hypothetical protein